MPEVTEPVLVLAPTGQDAALISGTVARLPLKVLTCSDLDEFASRLPQSTAGLLAQEALHEGAVPVLVRALRQQPPWSDVPVILMTMRRRASPALSRLLEDGMNITLLERPVSVQALLSAVASALRQRKRQYELRDRLADEQRTEERLRQIQKLESLGVLAGGIAHDFNNLLTGIIGNISLVLDCQPQNSVNRQYLEDALRASERAADLIRQLLAYSGQGRFTIQRIDLSALIRQIHALIRTSISKNIRVVLNLADGLPPTEGDPTQLQQVLMNLIINAAEAIGPDKDGLVVIETGPAHLYEAQLKHLLASDSAVPGDYVFIEVRDTGCGIDADMLPKIFDPFFTTKFLGRGLGLAAVQGIVRGHKGALKVESTPGKGSTFRILLPALASQQPAPTSPGPTTGLTGAGTILVVDDEEVIRKTAKNALASLGYRVLLADNGQIAVDLFARMSTQITMVLLDMTMPVMSGEETLRRLQSIQPNVKVILTSGYDEAEAMAKFTGTGLAGFLQKPYSVARLGACVKRVMESQGPP